MKKTYDAIIIVGYRFEDGWELSPYLKEGLQKVVQLYKDGVSDKIIVSGKWSLWFDEHAITPPTTESAEMKKILISSGVSETDILQEDQSKDTIGNAYFVKSLILEPNHFRKLLIICAQYHLPRVQYIFHKIFGADYILDFRIVATRHDPVRDNMQDEILSLQKGFLSPMKDGDDAYLKGKLYSDPFYHKK